MDTKLRASMLGWPMTAGQRIQGFGPRNQNNDTVAIPKARNASIGNDVGIEMSSLRAISNRAPMLSNAVILAEKRRAFSEKAFSNPAKRGWGKVSGYVTDLILRLWPFEQGIAR